MHRYEYKFIEVPTKAKTVEKKTAIQYLEETVNSEAKEGWRLQQVFMPFNEKTGVYMPKTYVIILEKRADENL